MTYGPLAINLHHAATMERIIFFKLVGLLSYIEDVISADGLVTQGAMTSAVMVLIYFSQNISVLASETFVFIPMCFFTF